MNKSFVIIIAILILILSISNAFSPKHEFSENENRVLAGPPAFTFSSLIKGEMSKEFESFVADQFIYRDKWVAAKAITEKISGKKENNGVYFAKDGFLIEAQKSFDTKTVSDNIKSINNLTDAGINTTLMLIPTAYEILNEKLPKYAYSTIQQQITSFANNSLSNATFVCPRSILSQNKEKYIFYKTDHHQTTLGSYYSYIEYCNSIGITPVSAYKSEIVSDSFYGSAWSKSMLKNTIPDTIEKVNDLPEVKVTYNDKETKTTIYDYEKLKLKDKYAFFLGGNYGKITIDVKNDTNKSICIIKDSYANSIIPFLINNYKKIIVIDLRYYNQSVRKLLQQQNINNVLYIYNVTNFSTDTNLKKLEL